MDPEQLKQLLLKAHAQGANADQLRALAQKLQGNTASAEPKFRGELFDASGQRVPDKFPPRAEPNMFSETYGGLLDAINSPAGIGAAVGTALAPGPGTILGTMAGSGLGAAGGSLLESLYSQLPWEAQENLPFGLTGPPETSPLSKAALEGGGTALVAGLLAGGGKLLSPVGRAAMKGGISGALGSTPLIGPWMKGAYRGAVDAMGKAKIAQAAGEAAGIGEGLLPGAGDDALSAARTLRGLQAPPGLAPAPSSSTGLTPASVGLPESPIPSLPPKRGLSPDLAASIQHWKDTISKLNLKRGWNLTPEEIESRAVNTAMGELKQAQAAGAGMGTGVEDFTPSGKDPNVSSTGRDSWNKRTLEVTSDPRTGEMDLPTSLTKPPEFPEK